MKLNFLMSELIHSDTAVFCNINNMPDINSLDNLLLLIANTLQPVRDLLGKPMIVTSGYRCPQLNRQIGGATNSEHTQGKACDFIAIGMRVEDIVSKIRHSNIPFNQLIEEHGKNGTWVHISYNKSGNKKEVLKYQKGIYTKI